MQKIQNQNPNPNQDIDTSITRISTLFKMFIISSIFLLAKHKRAKKEEARSTNKKTQRSNACVRDKEKGRGRV